MPDLLVRNVDAGLKARIERAVEWLRQNAARSYISAITVEEMTGGVARLPEGKRKRTLAKAIETALGKFGTRVVSFDSEQARACGAIEGASKSWG